MNRKKFIVMTSIHKPKKGLKLFSKLKDWTIVVVADKKTPQYKKIQNVVFLSLNQQRKLFGRFSKLIPFNNYSRKNIGYLYAMLNGADRIVETDDDNSPLPNWEKSILPSRSRLKLLTGPPVANFYRYFTPKFIWPRGFPLSQILDSSRLTFKGKNKRDLAIIQFLASAAPDVDAIYRLAINRNVSFAKRASVAVNKGVFIPMNSQNTLWYPDAFYFMYLPSYVDFRFTDILRGWVAQRCAWSAHRLAAFGQATLKHERNPHNVLNDFKSEITCYRRTEEIIHALRRLSLKNNPAKSLLTCYTRLHQMGVVPAQELVLVRNWIKLCQMIPAPFRS